MAQNYSLGASFGFNITAGRNFAPQNRSNANVQGAMEAANGHKSVFDNMELILSGATAEENNIIQRQMMLVGMGMKASDNTIRKFDMTM